MYLERRATQLVLDALQWSPVVLVEGPRQAGKSVLVRDLVGKRRPAAYVTLDDILRLASATDDPQGFVMSLPDPVVIDEIQLAPEIFRSIKLAVDEDRHPGHFTLTGSANVLLLPQLADSLAGRMRIVALLPLSQGEIEGRTESFIETVFADDPLSVFESSETRQSVIDRVVRGGFPEAVFLPAGAPRDGWMRAYVTTLLERDVREIARVADRAPLARLLRLLASRSATLLNASDLSRATGIARATMDRYLSAFERVFSVRMVPAWSGDVSRRLVKSPKLLFSDSGLACNLVGLDAQRLADDPNHFGPMLETFVGGELLKQISWNAEPLELMHFRDSRGAEVDWVIEDARGRLVGIEVKATSSPSARDFKGLRSLAAVVGDRFHRGIVLHSGKAAVPMGEGLWALPVESLWRL